MTLALRVLLIFGCFQNISPSRIHGKRYIISAEMNDKVSTDMGKPFPSGNQSLLHCVAHCGFAGDCESVSYSPSSCNGYSVIHSSILHFTKFNFDARSAIFYKWGCNTKYSPQSSSRWVYILFEILICDLSLCVHVK